MRTHCGGNIFPMWLCLWQTQGKVSENLQKHFSCPCGMQQCCDVTPRKGRVCQPPRLRFKVTWTQPFTRSQGFSNPRPAKIERKKFLPSHRSALHASWLESLSRVQPCGWHDNIFWLRKNRLEVEFFSNNNLGPSGLAVAAFWRDFAAYAHCVCPSNFGPRHLDVSRMPMDEGARKTPISYPDPWMSYAHARRNLRLWHNPILRRS